MTGQPREVPVNCTEVEAAARFAVVEFNRDSVEDQFAYKILNMTSAKTPVAEGINLILEVRLGRTVCKSSDRSDAEACDFNSEHKEMWCHFVVNRKSLGKIHVHSHKRGVAHIID